jgi:hypothetical protein
MATIGETNASWDLIAEMSKSENLDVYRALVRHYDQKQFTPDVTNADAQYLSYPESDMAALIKRLHLDDLLRGIDERAYEALVGGGDRDEEEGDRGGGRARKKKGGKKAKGAHVKRGDVIRHTQIIRASASTDRFFQRRVRGELSSEFNSNIIDVILLYYAQVACAAFESKRMPTFLDATFAFVSAQRYFRPRLSAAMVAVCDALLAWFDARMPWVRFLQLHTQYLISNHFKRTFRRSVLVPFREQLQLLQAIHDDPYRSFLMPWGVGTGKTSMLPVLARIYERLGYQTLYHVPYGPIRDQSAALLYRCGIPFAYMARCRGGGGGGSAGESPLFELQPSYHCSNRQTPLVLICDTAYLQWHAWCVSQRDKAARLVQLPSKARYEHFTVDNVWKAKYALIMDEPHGARDDVRELFSHIPPVTFVMSATLFDTCDELRSLREWYVVEPRSVGVSTTLVGHWLRGEPLVSPFTGCATRAELRARARRVASNILYKRFLSGATLVATGSRIVRALPETALSMAFRVAEVSFDTIADRFVAWIDQLVADPQVTDEAVRRVFSSYVAKPLPDVAATAPATAPETDNDDNRNDEHSPLLPPLLREFVVERSGEFRGGTVLCGVSAADMYVALRGLLAGGPTVEALEDELAKRTREAEGVHEQLRRVAGNELDEIMMLTSQLDNLSFDTVPIDEEHVINTHEYLEAHNTERSRARQARASLDDVFPATALQATLQEGEPGENWGVRLDTVNPAFRSEHPEALLWRYRGLGAIVRDKEFNMKNLQALEANQLPFMLIDALGAQGMNLKIANGILLPGRDGEALPTDLCLQAAGRVGRWNQQGSGHVYVTTPALFASLFAHVVGAEKEEAAGVKAEEAIQQEELDAALDEIAVTEELLYDDQEEAQRLASAAEQAGGGARGRGRCE